MSTQICVGRLATSQTLAVTGTSSASAAFGSQTFKVLVSATAACNIAISKSPTATTTSTALPANFPLVLDVHPGEQIAAVTASTATLNITELT
ncbi:MAG TPA: hypothetical protein VKY22_29390 [Bradyrhizobium sp.]|nr:hypothetical protein [Bradyrhizobium sp.]